ncbi:MAG: helix-turn-helix transcriptional regulator [Acidobacteriia bacterium]|nr:helix-turn-helix transcriptional regulator [Terriglobia bacterium]MYK12117.1 helix-turn-helix transcriptional regulator [Terriglobia bacterium]
MARQHKTKGSYTISVVAERFDVHPQTLRMYEREGLLQPSRTDGNTRLYTDEDIDRLDVILSLTRDLGVNLAGVEIILNMRSKMDAMQRQMREFVSYVNRSMDLAEDSEDPISNALIPIRTRMPMRARREDEESPAAAPPGSKIVDL